jgi:hypothetical protein
MHGGVSVGVGVAEKRVEGLPLYVSIFVGGGADRPI